MRTSSARKELKYIVERIPSDVQINSAISTYLQRSISSYGPQDRAIAFCRSKQQVTDLADLFKVEPYYAVYEDDEAIEKNRMTKEKWLSGENKIMVSTSILGCGMDYPHIRDVIHRDPSFTMLDQYQEDSRGGRDGLECRATTFVVDKKVYRVPDQPYDLGTQVLYESLSNTDQCRRIASTLYLDGQSKQCVSIPGAIFCDFCEKSAGLSVPITLPPPPPPPSPPRRIRDVFYKSPAEALQDFLAPKIKNTHSLDSTSSGSSKKLKVAHIGSDV